MKIFYDLNGALYANITNECPCACRFCLRNNGDSVGGNDSLWLEHEPTIAEIKAAFDEVDKSKYNDCRNIAVKEIGYKHTANKHRKGKSKGIKAYCTRNNSVHKHSKKKRHCNTTPHPRKKSNSDNKGNGRNGISVCNFYGKEAIVMDNSKN